MNFTAPHNASEKKGHNNPPGLWRSAVALDFAHQIARPSGIYCGPSVVVWIAAVWNFHKNVPYDYMARIKSKTLFPDGPRAFVRHVPGFQMNLSELLMRETRNELRLSEKRIYSYDEIHRLENVSTLPIIIRLPSLSIRNGLHYVALYKSEKVGDKFKFHCQDNGVIKSDVRLPEGLSIFTRRAGLINFFVWGAKQVVIN